MLITAFGASPSESLQSSPLPVPSVSGLPSQDPKQQKQSPGSGLTPHLGSPASCRDEAAQPRDRWIAAESELKTLPGQRVEVGEEGCLFIKFMFVPSLESKIGSKRFPLTSALASLLSHCR